MGKLGVSVYPPQGEIKKYKEYLKMAAKYGFTRVFTCLISLGENIDNSLNQFKEITNTAKELGMEVIADVEPSIFKKLNLSYKDLQFFSKLNLSGIRLDLGFSGMEESIMSVNPYGLKIEINMSNGTKYLDNILSYCPNKDNIIGCHNFYPHRYTGLSREHFLNTSREFKEKGIRTAAFVSSSSGTFGPWPTYHGLCTLEEHRFVSIDVQAKDLFNTGLIDDVIIANCFASEEELYALSVLNKDIIEFKVKLLEDLSEIEKRIVLKESHFNRGDISEYMIRSTGSRVKYKDHKFELFNAKPIKRGDVLIESSLYERYSGELQIALKDMENSGKTNVVGRINEDEIYLLDYIRPWQKFKFKL
ncbi:MAG: MupG family TIM beta-alpha barrel fold protein [Clostridiaceae bacterium]